MVNYKILNKKLDKLEKEYIENVNKFNKFSSIGNINYNSYTLNIIDENIIESIDNKIDLKKNKSIKKLLKLIHPDKIKIIFNEESPELLNCSNEIIHNNLDFSDAIKLLNKKVPKNVFIKICKKMELSENQINRIISNDCEKNIDCHFDQDFLNLVKKYNNMQCKTIYNYISNKVYILFSNLTTSFHELILQICTKLLIIDPFILGNVPENILMAREEFRIEHYLNSKTISILDLSLYYPNSNFTKTLEIIKENFPCIQLNFGEIKIEKYRSYNFEINESVKGVCINYLYDKFIESNIKII